jgi:hypothetical protein
VVNITLPTQGGVTLSGRENLLVGADGRTYLLAGHVVIQWQQTPQGFNLVQSADWNYRGAGLTMTSSFPVDAGVTSQGNIWLFYSAFYGGTSVYWLDPTGKILGSFPAPFIEATHLVAIDGMDVAYICGTAATDRGAYTAMCEAYRQDSTEPLWSYILGVDINGIVGAAVAPGRLYVITGDGHLTALADKNTATPAPTVTP